MVDTLTVALAGRSYDIHIGERLLSQAGVYIKPFVEKGSVIIVSDEQVAKFYLHRLTGSLEEQGIRHRSIIVPAGEGSKDLSGFPEFMERLLEQEPDRRTLLIALGGGVVGDLTGFAASTLLRGVDFVQIPTTLLAQVDSAVGGKTGVNSRIGKNLVGSFHQPRLVLSDISVLSTLPERERRAGYAEIVKYAFIDDAPFFDWLEQNGQKVLAASSAEVAYAVHKSCEAKADIVAEDEREAGRRALLNFGHTFGHALEAECGYSDTLLHGEAVSIGMVLAFQLSAAIGLCPAEDVSRAYAHLEACGLPVSPLTIRKDWDVDALIERMTHDKKSQGGALTLILAKGIGSAFVAHDVDKARVRETLKAVCGA